MQDLNFFRFITGLKAKNSTATPYHGQQTDETFAGFDEFCWQDESDCLYPFTFIPRNYLMEIRETASEDLPCFFADYYCKFVANKDSQASHCTDINQACEFFKGLLQFRTTCSIL